MQYFGFVTDFCSNFTLQVQRFDNQTISALQGSTEATSRRGSVLDRVRAQAWKGASAAIRPHAVLSSLFAGHYRCVTGNIDLHYIYRELGVESVVFGSMQEEHATKTNKGLEEEAINSNFSSDELI